MLCLTRVSVQSVQQSVSVAFCQSHTQLQFLFWADCEGGTVLKQHPVMTYNNSSLEKKHQLSMWYMCMLEKIQHVWDNIYWCVWEWEREFPISYIELGEITLNMLCKGTNVWDFFFFFLTSVSCFASMSDTQKHGQTKNRRKNMYAHMSGGSISILLT